MQKRFRVSRTGPLPGILPVTEEKAALKSLISAVIANLVQRTVELLWTKLTLAADGGKIQQDTLHVLSRIIERVRLGWVTRFRDTVEVHLNRLEELWTKDVVKTLADKAHWENIVLVPPVLFEELLKDQTEHLSWKHVQVAGAVVNYLATRHRCCVVEVELCDVGEY